MRDVLIQSENSQFISETESLSDLLKDLLIDYLGEKMTRNSKNQIIWKDKFSAPSKDFLVQQPTTLVLPNYVFALPVLWDIIDISVQLEKIQMINADMS